MSQVSLLEGLKQDLAELVAIPSISAAGYPEPTRPPAGGVRATSPSCSRAAGVQNLGSLDLPDTAPVVTGEIPAPEGAPTVLLYSHYDVVPAGDEALWTLAAVRADASATARSTAAAAPTPRPTSSPTSARCARGTGKPPVGHQARASRARRRSAAAR